ncbi:MAG: TIM barrel protein [Terrimicrobiaceae bacterium]|nr:TIM barrel protein [Terrimicrobiaceae bacterium]
MLALSTCWNSHRHTNGEDMLREIVDLGFQHVELSHGLNVSKMDGILKFAGRGEVRFTSLHNFCPQPVEVMSDSPDCFEFTSGRPEIRQRAVKMTLHTLEYAERLGAKRLVLHCGCVSPMRGFTKRLITAIMEGKFASKSYGEQKLGGVRQREEVSDAYIEALAETLKPVIEAATEKGIRLGIENRDSYEQLPSEREFPALLDRLGPACGYWHDFGHAQRKENMGFLEHRAWLAKIGPRAIGCHLHDARWPVEDHCVPFTGDIDYASLVPLLPKDIPFIIELHPKSEAAQIVAAADRWRKEFGDGIS